MRFTDLDAESRSGHIKTLFRSPTVRVFSPVDMRGRDLLNNLVGDTIYSDDMVFLHAHGSNLLVRVAQPEIANYWSDSISVYQNGNKESSLLITRSSRWRAATISTVFARSPAACKTYSISLYEKKLRELKHSSPVWALEQVFRDQNDSEARRVLGTDPELSLVYVKYTGNRFPEGEEEISKSATASLRYCRTVGYFPLGELTMCRDSFIRQSLCDLLRDRITS